MISVNQRILLVALIILIALFIFVNDLLTNKPFKLKCLNFVKLTVLFFPFIDLKIPPSEIDTKLLEALIFIFFIINFKTFTKRLKKFASKEVIIFIVVLIIMGLFSLFPLHAVFSVFRFSTFFILLLILREVITLKVNFYDLIFDKILIWAFLFYVLQLIFGIDFTFYNSLNSISLRDMRYTSFAQDPQKLAQIAYMLGAIYVVNIFSNKTLNKKMLFLALIAIIIGLSTGSRGSLVGFLFACIVMFFYKLNLKSIFIIFIISLGSWFLIDYIQTLQVYNRLSHFESDFDGRLESFWLQALNIFFDNYLIGVGTGNFELYVSNFHKAFTYGPEGNTVDQPENGYLMWLVETGIIGTCFYLYFIIKILLYKNAQSFIKPFKIAFIVWLIGFISVYSLTDVKLTYILTVIIALVHYSTYYNTLPSGNNKKIYLTYR
tara:strand:+ start:2538 stop:3839 length:1302 start_codon:yes stop_codon:yes gene_type:complete